MTNEHQTDSNGTGQLLYGNSLSDGQWHHLSGPLAPHTVTETVAYVLAGIHNSAPSGRVPTSRF